MTWTYCFNGMPKDNVTVIVTDGQSVALASLTNGHWYFNEWGGGLEVLAWADYGFSMFLYTKSKQEQDRCANG